MSRAYFSGSIGLRRALAGITSTPLSRIDVLHYPENKNSLSAVVHPGDQTIFVAPNVENRSAAYLAGAREIGTKL